MMFELLRHPGTPATGIRSIEVEVRRDARRRLSLRYVVHGEVAALLLPPPGAAGRADELWKTTCFEAFVRPSGQEQYDEFNFSPSRRWAAYRFDHYRAARRDIRDVGAPDIEVDVAADRLELRVGIGIAGDDVHVGLSAVVEDRENRKGYWALAHPAGSSPDFHHGDCFAALLRAPGRP